MITSILRCKYSPTADLTQTKLFNEDTFYEYFIKDLHRLSGQ